MYDGWLSFAGVEIINSARTVAYSEALLGGLSVSGCDDCENIAEALGDEPYTTPFVDQPDWVDPDNPDTWNFLGLLPLSIEGVEDSTRTAATTEMATDGGYASRPRHAGREIRVTGLLLGTDDAAVEAGMTWLRHVLEGDVCRSGGGCTGDHLCYFATCPPLCEDSPNLGQGTPTRLCPTGEIAEFPDACTIPYERHMYEVTCIEGPLVMEEFVPSCGSAMWRVEFTLYAGVPGPYGTPRFVDAQDRTAGDPEEPVLERVNLVTNPSFATGAGKWTDIGSPVSVQDTDVFFSAPGSMRVELNPQPEVVRTNHVMNPSFSQNGPATSWIKFFNPGWARDAAVFHSAPASARLTIPDSVTQTAYGMYTNTASGVGHTPIPGEVYHLTCWVRADPGVQYIVSLKYNNSSGGDGVINATGTGEWQFHEIVHTVSQARGSKYRAQINMQGVGINPPGSQMWVDDVFLELVEGDPQTGPESYFDGDTEDSGGLLYDWAGTVGNSKSTASVVRAGEQGVYSNGSRTYDQVPAVGEVYHYRAMVAARQNTVYRVELRHGSSPVNSRHFIGDGTWRLHEYTYTVLGNGDEGGSPYRLQVVMDGTDNNDADARLWVDDALLERVTDIPDQWWQNSYFDGDTADAGRWSYSWASGRPSESIAELAASMAIEDDDCEAVPGPQPLQDPNCIVPLPPRPPLVLDSCLEEPDAWRRYQMDIASTYIPAWSDAVPIIRLRTFKRDANQVRIRFYSNPFGRDVGTGSSACDYCGEFLISYIPKNSLMVIDGIERNAWVETYDGGTASAFGSQRLAASHLLYGSGGMPMSWPLLSCGVDYSMTVDVVPDTLDRMSVSLCVAERL